MESKKYNLKLNRINRPINSNHVAKLEKSMIKTGYWEGKPIQVNSELEILDGHHRYLAAKKLNINYHYIIENVNIENLDFMVNLNSSVLKYTTLDYFHLYAKKGYDDYITFLKYFDKFKKSELSNLIIILGGVTNTASFVRKGEFKFDRNGVLFLDEYQFFTSNLTFNISKELVWALRALYWFDEISFNKIKNNVFSFIQCATTEQYYNQILKILNYRLKKNFIKVKEGKFHY